MACTRFCGGRGRGCWARCWLLGGMLLIAGHVPNWAQQRSTAPAAAAGVGQRPISSPDLHRQPTLYLVGYAHLDTQWRWEYPQVITEFLPKTVDDNLALFAKYPHYLFNFTGANRYRMLEEYDPRRFAQVKRMIAAGRWFPAGSSMEENDVNLPSAESILRQILYGNEFFREHFGVASREYMLPDCFGFPASLPSLLAHAGLLGFSTQKLTWGSAAAVGGPDSPERTPRGIPFNVGRWVGPDGHGIIAALNPGDYSGDITEDLRTDPAWIERVRRNGQVSGLFTDYHYYGTGDTGGAPKESSVQWVERMLSEPAPPDSLHVVSATAEQMFVAIARTDGGRLPEYRGDLLLTNHSAGSLTSEAYQKRWNAKNEVLADAAERASVMASWLGGLDYPRQRLRRAWTLVLGGQFHDILAGTATPRAYEFSWNDDILAMNQFAGLLQDAVQTLSAALDTRVHGIPIVVWNSLEIPREDVVEAEIPFPGTPPAAVRVDGPDGRPVPAQLIGSSGTRLRILFLAKMPPLGVAVFGVRPAAAAAFTDQQTGLRVAPNELENPRYRLRLNANGDVVSLYDKQLGRELLAGPIRIAFQTEVPHDWPAWNMDWDDQRKPPRAYLGAPARVRVVEAGPVRVALEVTRQGEGSQVTQVVRLAAGEAGDRVEFADAIDWRTRAAALKATFPLAAANPQATYNWEVGTIERGNNDERKFEVPSHQWFDLTDRSGTFGVTVLSDAKYGSDKPDDHTLRLTLLYTPGIGAGNGRFYADQATQDWGHHEFVYGLAAHAGDWRSLQTVWQAYRLHVPLVAFTTTAHPGRLGKSFSFLRLSSPDVRILALKRAERSDEIILRVVELAGRTQPRVRVTFAAPVRAAREVNGQEFPVGPARLEQGALVFTLRPYQLRSFALRLGPTPTPLPKPRWQAVQLPYDRPVATRDGEQTRSGFDAAGNSLPAEMLPEEIPFAGVAFRLAPAGRGRPNAVVARGQTLALPAGPWNRVYVLAASANGDRSATFQLGAQRAEVVVEAWGGFIGQWDRRQFVQREIVDRRGQPHRVLEFDGTILPGFIKPARVAWFASHHHTAAGANVPYAYSYLFGYEFALPAGAASLRLPDDDSLRILAVTVAQAPPAVSPATPLLDRFPARAASVAEAVPAR